MCYGARLPWFKSWFCNMLAVKPQANNLASLCFTFLAYKMGIVIARVLYRLAVMCLEQRLAHVTTTYYVYDASSQCGVQLRGPKFAQSVLQVQKSLGGYSDEQKVVPEFDRER